MIARKSGRPVLRIGVLGDIQGLPARHDWGMRNFALALDQLKAMGIDLLLNLGDTAEGGNPETYRLYWQLIEERFGKDKLQHIACEGNHDFNRPAGYPAPQRFADICRGLRRSTENPLRVNVNGYDFIVLSADDGVTYGNDAMSRLEAMLRLAAETAPERPVFLLTHFPPAQTMSGSFCSTTVPGLREMLDRYPQVISLSGHTHFPVNDDRALWQGSFTAITCGTLAYGCMLYEPELFNCVNGILPFAREAAQYLCMELSPDRIVIRRFNAIEGVEIAPENRWCIPLPFRKPEALEMPAPEFAPGAQLLTRYDYGYMYLLFDRPTAGAFAQFFDVEITAHTENGDETPVRTRYAGDFYRLTKNRQGMISLKLPGLGMKSGAWYRLRVYAVGSSGKRSAPLEILEHVWPGYKFRDGTPLYPQE